MLRDKRVLPRHCSVWPLRSKFNSKLTLMPRLIVHVKDPSFLTDAIVTSAPKRVNVSVIDVVSISSEPSAIGTNTFFVMSVVVVEPAKERSIKLLFNEGVTKALRRADERPNTKRAINVGFGESKRRTMYAKRRRAKQLNLRTRERESAILCTIAVKDLGHSRMNPAIHVPRAESSPLNL